MRCGRDPRAVTRGVGVEDRLPRQRFPRARAAEVDGQPIEMQYAIRTGERESGQVSRQLLSSETERSLTSMTPALTSARTRVCHQVIGGGLRDAGNAHSAAVGALDVRPFPVPGCPGVLLATGCASAKDAHHQVPLVRCRERLQAASGETPCERRGSSGSARRAMPGRRRRGGRSGLESASPPKQCGRMRAVVSPEISRRSVPVT